MRKAIIFGGPRDGEELEIADFIDIVVFPALPLKSIFRYYGDPDPALEEQEIEKIIAPVRKWSDGSWKIQWPKDVN